MTPPIRDQFQSIRSFYRWWLSALSALLTRQRPATQPWRILLLRREEGLEVIENVGGKAVSLVALARPHGPLPAQAAAALRAATRNSGAILLRLSAEDVVERTIRIPKGAGDVIEPVLRNQMNRIVPWPQEETRFGYTVAENGRGATDQFDIQVAATTRTVLDAALADARAIGVEPSLVDYAPREAPGVGTVLLSLAPDPRLRMARRLHVALVALLAICLLAGGTGVYQLWRLENEKAGLEARIATVRKGMAEASNKNAPSGRLREAAAALIQRKAGEPPVIRLIDALSRALPDNAYLTELEIQAGAARMVGKSDEATALIAAIEAAPEYEDARFAAPTMRQEGGGAESFAVMARVSGAPRAEDAHDHE